MRELCGWTDGWTDGRMDGDQKCPSIFVILMYVKDHIYMYLCTQKLSPRFLWVSKFDVKLGSGYDFQKTTYVFKKRVLAENLKIKNYTRYVCFRSELLYQKKEKSPTFCNFKIFDHDPQLDKKF